MQDHPVKVDLIPLLAQIHKRMNDQYQWAFPNHSLDKSRGHPTLCRIGTYARRLLNLCSPDALPQKDELQSIFLQQAAANAKVILDDKEWAYPDNSLSENRIASTLHCVQTSLKNFDEAILILGKAAYPEPASYDLLRHFYNNEVQKQYEYAYPDDHFSAGRGHACAQMLMSAVDCEAALIKRVLPGDEALAALLKELSAHLDKQSAALKKVYPNNNYDEHGCHAQLSSFIRSWKDYRDAGRSGLRAYYESCGFELRPDGKGIVDGPSAALSKRSAAF